MEAFLREVETRAFRIAIVSIRDRDEALDVVQDAMIRLVRRYARRPSEEWRPLFYRILQNRIRDVQRRRIVRSKVLSFFGGTENEEYDPVVAAHDVDEAYTAKLIEHYPDREVWFYKDGEFSRQPFPYDDP